MATQLVFTRASVASAQVPLNRPRNEYRDPTEPGLYLYVTSEGVRTFYLYKKVKGEKNPCREKLGRYPDISVSQAKRKAQELKGRIAQESKGCITEGLEERLARKLEERIALNLLGSAGTSVIEEKQVPTLSEVAASFLKVRKLRPKTRSIYQLGYEKLSGWHSRPVDRISKGDIIKKHQKIADQSGGAMADSTMRTLRAFFEFYREQEDQNFENPVKTLSANKLWKTGVKNRRKRYIPLKELPGWVKCFQELEHETWAGLYFLHDGHRVAKRRGCLPEVGNGQDG